MQRVHVQGGAIGRHVQSEGSAHTPLLYCREGVCTPLCLPFVGTGGTVPTPVHPHVRLCAGCTTPHIVRAPARSPGCTTPTHRISPVPPALRAQTKPGCRRDRCYALVERSAWLEQGGYDSVVWHVVLEACASDTQWGLMDFERMGGTGLRGRGRYPRRTRCSGGICMFRTSRLDWYENSDLRSKSAIGTV